MATINLRALRESYRIKQLTDTSFRATVIAFKVVLFALAFLLILLFAFQGIDFESSGPGTTPKIPHFLDSP